MANSVKLQVSILCTKCGLRSVCASGSVDPQEPTSFTALESQIGDQVKAPCVCGIEHLLQELHLDDELAESIPFTEAFQKYDELGRRPQKDVLDDIYGDNNFG